MASYRAKGGIEIADEMIDQWDEEAYNGIYHGEADKVEIRKSLGRPASY